MATEITETRPVGVIGLGEAGRPMARALLHAGLPVVAYDVRPEAVDAVVALGATRAEGVAALARVAGIVITSLPRPSVSEDVVLGAEGVLQNARRGAALLETSTVPPGLIKRMEEAAEPQGVSVIDAGISGIRYADTTAGPFLNMMVGSRPAGLERVQPVLDALGKKVFHVGPPGAGMSVKLVNNAMAMTAVATFCEATALGIKAGMDPAILYEVISQSGGSSRMFVDSFPRRVMTGDYEGGFGINLSAKDLALALEWARETGVPMPVVSSAYSVHEWGRAKGLGNKDCTALMTLWEDLLGIKATARAETKK